MNKPSISSKITFSGTSAFIKRLVLLNVGLFICALGTFCSLQSGLGVNPWDVFHIGASHFLPFTIGQISQLTGLTLIILNLFLGTKPGIGTISNMFFIGFWFDVINNSHILPKGADINWVAQVGYIFAALWLFAIGSALYIKPKLGAGPRDSLMLTLVRKTGWRVAVIRGLIEVTATFSGWLMGGPVGVGTVILALGLGPAVEVTFRIFRVESKKAHVVKTPELVA